MHALGNDFAVFYGNEALLEIISQQITKLSDRQTGIGFDQLLFVMKQEDAVFYFHIFNADGSQASQCLNGARCVARFLIEKKHIKRQKFFLSNASGVLDVDAQDFEAISLKILNQVSISQEKITIDTLLYHFTKVSMGNDHLITTTEQNNLLDVPTLGKLCQSYCRGGINVGFVELISEKEIKLRTYERGTGETLCCASNALATVAVGIAQGWLKETVTVNYTRGSLRISLSHDRTHFYLTGSASYCYDGVLSNSSYEP